MYTGMTPFYLLSIHEPYTYLYFPYSRMVAPPFGYTLRLQRKDGQAELACKWLVRPTYRDVPHRELKPDTVTHPSTNRARRRLISLNETNALPYVRYEIAQGAKVSNV